MIVLSNPIEPLLVFEIYVAEDMLNFLVLLFQHIYKSCAFWYNLTYVERFTVKFQRCRDVERGGLVYQQAIHRENPTRKVYHTNICT